MIFIRILPFYVLKEYLANLGLGLLIFTFVLVLDHLFELMDLVINKGVGIWLTLQMLALLLPSSLSLTLPMASLLAALLTFGHFSETNEITAIRASGLSSWSFVQTPIFAGVLMVCFLVPFNTRWAPHAHAGFQSLYVQVLERNPLVRIEEKTFVEIGEYHLYAEKRNRKTRELSGVSIYKTPPDGPPLRIFADKGHALVSATQGVTLVLENGRIDQIDPVHPTRWFSTNFQTYQLAIPLESHQQASATPVEEMDSGEIKTQISALKSKNLPYAPLLSELHLRLALAMTPLLFILMGIPLAIRVQRGARSIGFAISLGIIVGYYVLLMGGTWLAQRGVWPAWIAIWLGNLVTTAIAIGLNVRFLVR